MITIEEADKIIQSQLKDFGNESILFSKANGRILAEDLMADRDLPPFNRVTMDGICINYQAFEKGIRSFIIKATMAAGDVPVNINSDEECIEIMTGAALPDSTDTVISYEEIDIKNKIATLKKTSLTKGQNIHQKGTDKKKFEPLITAGQIITPAVMGVAASIGKLNLHVKKLPKVVIISSGDELVDVDKIPTLYQIRRSNSYTIKAALMEYKIEADTLHIPDELKETKAQIQHALEKYDAIILSGGVSMGKFDYIPQALQELSVQMLFHKVQQRPGKPIWFGKHANGALVFALPGNPISTFMCFHRYVLPWLNASSGLSFSQNIYAILDDDITFNPALQYFLLVKTKVSNEGKLLATPVITNTSGDFANLLNADAFMELPLEQNNFTKGEVFKIWPFKNLYNY